MADGQSILEDARKLAYPRYPGSEGDARAIDLLEQNLRNLGLETSLEWFSYDIEPAQRTLRAGLAFGALLTAGAGVVSNHSPVLGLTLLGLTLVPGLVFLTWAPWLQRLYRRPGRTRTANVVGRRPVRTPRKTLIMMAHHDSKSQSLNLPCRVGLTVVAMLGVLAVTGIAASRVLGGSPPLWSAPVAGGLAAVAALLLSTMRSANESPGAVDNAGSVAVMLDVARRLIETLPDDVELVVLLTGAEEDHMIGAIRWLDAHAEGLVQPTFCLNFDGAGAAGREVLIERFGLGRRFAPEISRAARRAAARLGARPRAILMLPGVGIDAIPFAHHGIPCLTFASGSLDHATMSVHSRHDTVENLHPAALARIADLAYETAIELCGAANDSALELPLDAD